MVDAPSPSLAEVTIADDPDAWRKAGFTVDDDGACRVGTVTLRLVGDDGSRHRGIRSWSLRDLPNAGATDIDGLVTLPSGVVTAPADHANTVAQIDHLVVLSPDLGRTVARFAACGLDEKRRRETDTYGAPMTQVFFRMGEVILELIGPPEPSDARPARFFGLAFTAEDLEEPSRLLGDAVGDRKPAVQPGRDKRSVRHEQLGISVPLLLMSR